MTDKGKKAKVEEDDGSEQLDTELVLSIQKLQDVQDALEKVNEEASDKVLEVEQKYNEVRRPIYQKRNEIIEGIADFWLTAFLSHPALCELLTEEDQQVFKFLQSLDVEDFKDVKSGYSITFTFRPNPYFEDSKLVKVFRFSDEGITSISGTHPRWKEGMDFTNGNAPAKDGNKRSFLEESFFKWFSETEQKESSEGPGDEVAEIIKEDLWPNPLKYFNNEADDDEDEFEDGEDEDEDEDGDDQGNGAENDGEDDDEDDEDDDEDEDDE